jgi:uncharacterized protein YbjT (DUF2867 family)
MDGGRILVAGATGRVGGAAVRHLLEAGYEVRALVRGPRKAEHLRSLGAEPVVGDVTKPDTLAPAVEGCSGVYSVLAAGPGRGDPQAVEYEGNVNLLRATLEAGAPRFVYSSALHADHPLARDVGELREKARFEDELAGTEVLSYTILRPSMFMENLLLALRGFVAFVPGRQKIPATWISADDVARAAVRAFERDIEGRHELAGPDSCTFDEAYSRLARTWDKRISVLHPPLFSMRLPGRFLPSVGDIVSLFAFFDRVGYAADPSPLRDLFGVEALTIEEWAGRVSRSGSFG